MTYRPEYEILLDYHLSKKENQNLNEFSIIEFGVASGKSLKYLEKIVKNFERKFKISISIYGFDTFSGMPKSNNPLDHLHSWAEGDFESSIELVKKKLSFSKLIIGNVGQSISIKNFIDNNISNIGMIIFDLDYYTSTNSAFKIFDDEFLKYCLPRVGLFFDNLHSATEFSGEYLSIKEFNLNNNDKLKYISKDFYLEKFDNRYFQFLNFNDSRFNLNFNQKQKL